MHRVAIPKTLQPKSSVGFCHTWPLFCVLNGLDPHMEYLSEYARAEARDFIHTS